MEDKKQETRNRRVVVKIGSSSLQHPETGDMNLIKMEHLARELCDLRNQGMDVCLVSSGAIATGRKTIGLTERPKNISVKQACAAVGQAKLMMIYQKMFAEYNQMVGQVLMTKNTMINNVSRKNAQNTFEELFHLGVIPIVNENDSVSYKEIESEDRLFGDNDMLSAVVAVLCRARHLVILSDIDGFYDHDPRLYPNAKLIEQIDTIDDSVYALAGGAGSRRGTGGMRTKLQAAALATSQGTDTIVTNGKHPEALYDIVKGLHAGTLFPGKI